MRTLPIMGYLTEASSPPSNEGGLENESHRRQALRARSIEQIQALAQETLNNLNENQDRSIFNQLFDFYDETEDIMSQSAIAYLLKNDCKIPEKPENPKKFVKRRRKAEIKLTRLTEKLNGKAPQGRDLTGQKWLDTLFAATIKISEDENDTNMSSPPKRH